MDKDAIMALAEQVGVLEAARRTGTSPNTLKSWRRRERARRSPAEVPAEAPVSVPEPADDPSSIAAYEKRCSDAWRVAAEALTATSKAIKSPKGSYAARNFSVTLGVLTDKAIIIEAGIERMRDRQVELTRAQSEVVLAMLRCWSEAIGVPFGQGSATSLLAAQILRMAESSEALSADQTLAEQAKAEIRATRMVWTAEEMQPRWEKPQLALPAPSPEPARRSPLAGGDLPRRHTRPPEPMIAPTGDWDYRSLG